VRGVQHNGTDPNTKMNWKGFHCAKDLKDSGESQEAKSQQTSSQREDARQVYLDKSR